MALARTSTLRVVGRGEWSGAGGDGGEIQVVGNGKVRRFDTEIRCRDKEEEGEVRRFECRVCLGE